MQKLKACDPELYRQIVGEKKARLRKGLQTFREKRPERYQAFLRREKEFKKRELDYFREHHPQAPAMKDLLILEMLGEDEGALDAFDRLEAEVEFLMPASTLL